MMLQTSNPEQLEYENDLLKLTVLGGIKLEGLDRMRVTLKIELKDTSIPAIRHNLDLYNDTQLEKLIRKTAERLELGTSIIAASLNELTEQLEHYRIEELEKQTQQEDKKKFLTPEEVRAAQAFLAQPNLIERTNQDIGRAGVIGEETNRLLMYLIFTSRKREQPLHIVSLGSSGVGKTHLQEKVGALIPEEDKIEITTLSENAFYYFGQRELKNKLILIEDLDGAEGVLYPLRELQSKKHISKTVVRKNTKGETKTISLKVEGPVSVSGCTTRESLYEDNANRSFLIHIDESAEQDEQIMAYQRAQSAGELDKQAEHQIREQLKNTQRVLQPITVRNPFAHHLKIPKEVFKPRRTNAHYLAFIEAVTFYHQYQREEKAEKETGELYIETTLEDIEIANRLLKEVLLRKSDQLNGATRKYFEKLKHHIKEQVGEGAPSDPEPHKSTEAFAQVDAERVGDTFTNHHIRHHIRIKASTLKRYHTHLLEAGLIEIVSGKPATGYHYRIVDRSDYEKLQKGITSVLDQVLEQCKQLSGPVVAHQPSELRKQKKTSKLNGVAYTFEKREAE
ncbi:MAG: hypothetical protein AAF843_18845 [Bacteroidota bacterium]